MHLYGTSRVCLCVTRIGAHLRGGGGVFACVKKSAYLWDVRIIAFM